MFTSIIDGIDIFCHLQCHLSYGIKGLHRLQVLQYSFLNVTATSDGLCYMLILILWNI